jgi:hypothetical protein
MRDVQQNHSTEEENPFFSSLSEPEQSLSVKLHDNISQDIQKTLFILGDFVFIVVYIH